MKGIIISLLLVSLFQCNKGTHEINRENTSCGRYAKVVDMAGLDGCGLMFELADGTRLDPERRVYVQAPTLAQDPLYHFDLKSGQEVTINWEQSLALNSCMAGPIVFITCIEEVQELVE